MVAQRTNEWKDQRLYRYTSSCIFKLLTEPKSKEAKEAGELGEVAKEYVMEKIAEELGGFQPEFENDATRWGNENEPKAVYWYEKITGFRVQEVGFQEVNEFYGGSPDRLVIDSIRGDKGALEVKCPFKTTNHLWHCLIDSVSYFKKNHKDYYWQCLSHMITLNVDWCEFISFDPRINNEVGFFRFRMYKDEKDAIQLQNAIFKANEYKQYVKSQLGLK